MECALSRDVALLGMMGAGKTTVAEVLAARLGRQVRATDAEVERRAGRTVAEVFAADGEAGFRALEASVVREAGTGERILDLGGGVVLDPANVDALRETAVLVHLEAPAPLLVARLAEEGSGTRPLLAGQDLEAGVRELAAARAPTYAAVADHTVDASAPPARVADAILAWAAGRPDVLTDRERGLVES